MLSKSRLIQLVIMLVVLVALFIWRTLEQKTDRHQVDAQGELTIDELADQAIDRTEPLCDFSRPCVVKTQYGDFYLSVQEKQVSPEQWINLSLQSELKNWKIQKAQTVGKSMFMGRIPITFKSTSDNLKTAKTMVGACTEEEMVWRFDIMVEVEGSPVSLYYDFLVKH